MGLGWGWAIIVTIEILKSQHVQCGPELAQASVLQDN
jgi:hypothetical protein